MKNFMDKDFLLNTKTAQYLYHEHAEAMPIIDYHCHINPAEIASNKIFDNITQAWLYGDHYKWRLMRSNGIEEHYITGSSSDIEKFHKFAETLPKAIGNPLYHWTHLELQRYFNCDTPLNSTTADEIWQLCNKQIAKPEMSVPSIIKKSNVDVICTTDDPIDNLEYHKIIKSNNFCSTSVLPAMRPDKLLGIDKSDFISYIDSLSKITNITITKFDDICNAIQERIIYFNNMGCKVCDHGFEYLFFTLTTKNKLDDIIKKALNGEPLTVKEIEAYKTHLFMFLAEQYKKYDWAMQIHFSVQRNPNTTAFNLLGPDSGFDCINTTNPGVVLCQILNNLQEKDTLPKTILYSLNPNDNDLIASIIGAFQGSEIGGKIQLGSGWWFNDTKTGMINQLTTFANYSVLGNFIGMLTDSRSFLSYTRHEYFRRILCNLIGAWVENGEYPNDKKMLGSLVENISYYNSLNYFNFKK